ncbi:MAG: radical SAM protein [Gemmatimonadaceae bacterium]
MEQALFLSDTFSAPTRHPVVGTQKDIRYYGTMARGVLNSPESTGMAFWSINPYIGCAFGCTYCYARYAHRFVMERATSGEVVEEDLAGDLEELPAWLAFERRIFVKRNAAQVLRRTLQGRRESLGRVARGETIAIGTATDPYQPAERIFRITREILAVLADVPRLRLVIVTKSPLITRDVDLLVRIAQHSRLTVHLSLITLDRELARRVEPRAPTPEARLRALQRLSEAGLDVGINIMPVLPGITDRPDALADLVRRVARAGASHINACALRLRQTSRKRYLPWLDTEFPDLAERYDKAYANGYQIHDRYREGLRHFLKSACRKAGIRYGSPEERAFTHDPATDVRAGVAWEPEPEDEEFSFLTGKGNAAPRLPEHSQMALDL